LGQLCLLDWGGRPGGPTLLVDGERQAAPGPVDAMMIALASCSAIDVVDILAKRRTPASALRVEVEFERAAGVPRRVLAAHLRWVVSAASERSHVERAVQLSVEKYCSVAASLAPDLRLSWDVEVHRPGGEP
ncbi:MAG: OsmC family protein, partial [Gemmatimonadetes bacterium]|nr:OsmC family protein [Gemmatimonadota bacterium]